MKILILSQWFDPEPTPKGLAFARALRDMGHQVEVLTGFPNYPEGRLYPGYRLRPVRIETVDGIRIVRAALYPSHDSSARRRIANYLSFAASAVLIGLLFPERPDVIYVYHPPATVGVAGAVLGFLRRAPFVFDIQDLWPDTLPATGMLRNRWLLAVVDRVCRLIYRRAARIIVQSPGFGQRLVERDVAADKIDLIYNWCDEAAILQTADTPAPTLMDGHFNIVFAGTMGKAQALEAVLRAAALLDRVHPRIRFVFVGGGVELDRLKALKDTLALSNVMFAPRVPYREVGAFLQAADVLLVHLRDDPLFAITIPSKIQAYLAVGKPVLLAVRGDAARLIEDARCGEVARPEDPADIAAAALRLHALSPDALRTLGENARRHYEAHLCAAIGTRKSAEVLKKAAGR